MSRTSGTRHSAIVTGGGGGIGRATALRLAEDGCDVVVADIAAAGADVAAEIAGAGGLARFVRTDVADAGSSQACSTRRSRHSAVRRCSSPRRRCSARSTRPPSCRAGEFQRVLDVNLTGVLLSCQACCRTWLERGWGRIVAISSNARHGVPRASRLRRLEGRRRRARDDDRARVRPGGRARKLHRSRPRADAHDRPALRRCLPRRPAGRRDRPARAARGDRGRDRVPLLGRNTYAVGALWEATGGLEIG